MYVRSLRKNYRIRDDEHPVVFLVYEKTFRGKLPNLKRLKLLARVVLKRQVAKVPSASSRRAANHHTQIPRQFRPKFVILSVSGKLAQA